MDIQATRRAAILILCGAVALVATGCRDLRSFDEVEAAFENPSGRLDDGNAASVFRTSLLGQEADDVNLFAAGHSNVPTDVGSAVDFLVAYSDGELGTKQQALFGECSPHLKLRGTKVNKISFDCGDSGDITGSFTLDLDWKDDELRGFFLDYDMFCELDQCIDGSLGVRWSLDGSPDTGLTTSLIASARFSVIRGSKTYHVDWGWRLLADEDELRFEWLVWTTPDRDGDSFVLSAVVNTGGGHLEVRDAEGWWRCDYGPDALEGECYRCSPEGTDCVPIEGGQRLTWVSE